MKDITISFIGGGNMASSLVGGLIADGFEAPKIWVADPDPAQRERLAERFFVNTTADNDQAVAAADVIVLAVKPQVLTSVAKEVSAAVQEKHPLVVSIAAGVRTESLYSWLGEGVPVIRAMPNTPALVSAGASALYATAGVSEAQRNAAESVLRSVGTTTWVDDEALMDVVTALSGSGPAYFFLVMEAMQQTAVKLGLPESTARLLTLETALGAAKMAIESNEDVATLRARVTSPGGTTEQALKTLEEGHIRSLFNEALEAARHRSEELADWLGRND